MEHKTSTLYSRRFQSAVAFLIATAILEVATPTASIDVNVLAGLFAGLFGLLIYGYSKEDSAAVRKPARIIVQATPWAWDDKLLDFADQLDEIAEEPNAAPAVDQ